MDRQEEQTWSGPPEDENTPAIQQDENKKAEQPVPDIATHTQMETGIKGIALFSVMAALMLTLLLEALDQTIVGTALPQIISQFQGFDSYSWVGTAYLLASITTIPITGKLSDVFGRKWFFISGVSIFLLGSFLSGAAQNMSELIAFRAVQGFGSGMGISLVFAAVGELIAPAERARWQGVFSGVFGFSSVVGPTLGGWLTDHGPLIGNIVTNTTRWRWIFYVNLPLGILALLALFIYYPNRRLSRHSVATTTSKWEAILRIDFAGALLISIATVCLLLGLSWGSDQTYAWNSVQVITILAGSAIVYLLFIFVERTARDPIIPLNLFKNQVFASDSLLALMVGMILLSQVYYLPFFLQGVMGTSATNSGLVMTPLTISTVIGAATSGILMGKLGRYQIIAICGVIILGIGTFLFTQLNIHSSFLILSVSMVISGFGLGVCFPIMTLAGQNAHPRRLIGVTTSTINYLRSMGQTLGLAIVGTVVTHITTVELPLLLPAGARQLSPQALQAATNTEALIDPGYEKQVTQITTHYAQQQAVNQTTAQVPAGPHHGQQVAAITQQVSAQTANQVHTILDQTFNALTQAFSIGITRGFIATAIFCGIAFVGTLFLKDVPLGRAPEQVARKKPTLEETPVAVELE